MILLDSVYINDGGGLVLLKYLIEKLKDSELDVFYLFDDRVKSSYENDVSLRDKIFIKNTIKERKNFYLKNKERFKTVLCFGNVPPPIKLNIPVYVYFHQSLFLKIPTEFSIKNKVVYKIKQLVLNHYKNHATTWLVQSKFIQESFAAKYLGGNTTNVKVLPFYPPLASIQDDVFRHKSSFIYISNTSPHKNHIKLIEAFCKAFDKLKVGSLSITVPPHAVEICALVNEKRSKGYPIKNLGFMAREKLPEIYFSHEFLIFPSLAESFGLGLAEAIDGGCKVIAADLPYTYQVCNPSLTFNPYSIESIESAIIKSVSQELPESNKIITNDINQLILLLSE